MGTEVVPSTMTAVLLTRHGGPDALEFRTDVPTPAPGDGEVLIRVAAAGVNNTDINTRTAWYSKASRGATASDGAGGGADDDASWSGVPLQFPRIQGADVAGHVVAVGSGVDPGRLGERVIARTMMSDPTTPTEGYDDLWTLGSECDGGFAQYCALPSVEVYPVECDWSDSELASIPCAYSTAEGMLHRAEAGAERVLVTGASGGVGSAAVQLAKRRGAEVTAVCSPSKADAVRGYGADHVIDRGDDLVQSLGRDSVDVVVDLVAGEAWPSLLEVLVRGGRYVTSGAIAGPICEIDIRTLYLKDLTLMGSTFQDREVFTNLIGYIERGEIRPLVSKTYALADIAEAQADFTAKTHPGKLVLIPPP